MASKTKTPHKRIPFRQVLVYGLVVAGVSYLPIEAPWPLAISLVLLAAFVVWRVFKAVNHVRKAHSPPSEGEVAP
jgi:hypothetical protein